MEKLIDTQMLLQRRYFKCLLTTKLKKYDLDRRRK